jgi:hypothetical protein
MQFSNDIKKTSTDKDKAVNIIRHAVLSSIKAYKKKHRAEYGELILACDGDNYWRKKEFPYYKAGRKSSREESDLDWKLIFDTLNELREDLVNHFPYKVLRVDGAEGDDIIATMVKWTQDNGYVTEGLFEEPQKVIIISSDGDFKQLQKYGNVKQWSPMQKKFVVAKNPKAYLMEHITKAGDDGIPAILSPDDILVTKASRQPSISAKRLAEFIELGRDACRNDVERRGWDRNQKLIDFDYIPDYISKAIIDMYENQVVKGTKATVMNYLIKKRCRMLLETIDEF